MAEEDEPPASVVPPALSPDQQLMGALLSIAQLRQLAQGCQAQDQRRRKLPCEVFFWLVVLACGPGGAARLQAVCTYLSAAQWMSGQPGPATRLSK